MYTKQQLFIMGLEAGFYWTMDEANKNFALYFVTWPMLLDNDAYCRGFAMAYLGNGGLHPVMPSMPSKRLVSFTCQRHSNVYEQYEQSRRLK